MLYGIGLSMHFLHEKNGIWITPQSKVHLSLCGRCTFLQRRRASLLKITLVIMDDHEHPISLILPVCFQLNHFLGGGFLQDLVGVLWSVHLRAVRYAHENCFTPDIWLFLTCDRNLLCSFCWFWCLTLHTYLACLVIALKHAPVLACCCSHVQSTTSEQYGPRHLCWHCLH